jgi:trans-aconitate methyltransferase
MLELGCGFGDLGEMFRLIGADITSVDARYTNIEEGKKRHPYINFICQDLDANFDNLSQFDFVLDTGLLYHLTDHETHIKCLRKVLKDVLILETKCIDTDTDYFLRHTDPDPTKAYDQSFSGFASTSSQSRIEKLLSNAGFDFEIQKTPLLNADFYRYDWEISNTYNIGGEYRRLWICYPKS